MAEKKVKEIEIDRIVALFIIIAASLSILGPQVIRELDEISTKSESKIIQRELQTSFLMENCSAKFQANNGVEVMLEPQDYSDEVLYVNNDEVGVMKFDADSTFDTTSQRTTVSCSYQYDRSTSDWIFTALKTFH